MICGDKRKPMTPVERVRARLEGKSREGLVGSMTAADLIDLVDFLSAQRADEN